MTLEEIELLSELTIVIPTYNRPFELERSIEYWRDTPVTVHILDGSEEPWFSLGSLKDASNITYHHMPAENGQNPQESVFQRVVYGSKLSNTKFSAIGCDDDFYTISGLNYSLKLLKSQPNFDAVVGRVLTYQTNNSGQVLWWCKYLNWKDHDSAKSSDFSERVFGKKNWFLYGVCRTELWKGFLNASYSASSYSNDQAYAHEWLMKQLSASLFKTKFLERITIVRQNTQNGWNEPDKVQWSEWLDSPKFKPQVSELVKQLSDGLALVCDDAVQCDLIANELLSKEKDQLHKTSENTPPPTLFRRQNLLKLYPKIPKQFKSLLSLTVIPVGQAVGLKSYKLISIMYLLIRWGVAFDRRELKYIQSLILKTKKKSRF